MSEETDRPDGPYFLEVDSSGCGTCGGGRTWQIVSPDDVGTGKSWGDEEEAAHICGLINDAYRLGRAEARPITSPPPEVGDWRPIGTAPRDGTVVELMNAGSRLTDTGHWCDYTGGTRLDGEWSQEAGNGDMTHWRPRGSGGEETP